MRIRRSRGDNFLCALTLDTYQDIDFYLGERVLNCFGFRDFPFSHPMLKELDLIGHELPIGWLSLVYLEGRPLDEMC